jgi:hypothetical protein
MQVKATTAAIKLYRAWLSDIINENILNDQKVLNFAKFGAVFDSSCNWPSNRTALVDQGSAKDAGPRFCVYSGELSCST